MQPVDDTFLEMFERFLQLPAGNLERTLSEAADLVAGALQADKVDVFLYHPGRASLVSLGTSHQPLAELQRQVGLDVLPLANGGLIVEAYRARAPLLVGTTSENECELRGIREVLRLESQIVVMVEVGGRLHGVLAVASRTRHRWAARHLGFAQQVARWVGILAHRTELLVELERRSVAEGRRAAAEELVTMVAHDLRNHLAPIRLRLHALQRRAEREARTEDVREAGAALCGVTRINDFVTDLLDVARIDRDLFELRPELVDMVALARDVAAIASTEARRVQVEVHGRVAVVGDPERIRQLIENLVANALAHTPREGRVTLRVASDVNEKGAWARLQVIDEGPGVAEHLRPHIFERFVSESRGRGSLGLGLYIAKQIAVRHAGDLVLESAPGGGACFVLTLPLDA